MGDNESFVRDVLNGDVDGAQLSFDSLLKTSIGSKIAEYRVAVAQNLLGVPDDNNSE